MKRLNEQDNKLNENFGFITIGQILATQFAFHFISTTAPWPVHSIRLAYVIHSQSRHFAETELKQMDSAPTVLIRFASKLGTNRLNVFQTIRWSQNLKKMILRLFFRVKIPVARHGC